jgi:hypothetical protein
MRASFAATAAALVLALLAGGCGHAEQIHKTHEYERFLKDSLGAVAPDTAPAALQAQASAATDHAVD